jgi:signal transduction histidine kinase
MIRWMDVELPAEAAEVSPRGQAKLLHGARHEILRRTYGGTFSYPLLFVTLGVLNGEFGRRPSMMIALIVVSAIVVGVRVKLYRRAIADTSRFGWSARWHVGLGVASTAALSIYAGSAFVLDGGTAASVAGFVSACGIAGMVVTIASVRRSLAIVWTWAAIVPLLATTLWEGTPAGYALAALFAYFALILATAIGTSHRAYWDAQLRGMLLDEQAQESLALTRLAGMAEIATNVLHDVGNTLNSVKSTVVEMSNLHTPDTASDLRRIAAVVAQPEGAHALATRGTAHGPEFAAFVAAVAADAQLRYEQMTHEIERLRAHTEHIERVVRRQQDIATGTSDCHQCDLGELVDAAIDLLGRGFARHSEVLKIDIPASLAVVVDRHTALQILVNVVKNAFEATGAVERPSVEISAAADASGFAVLSVRDNGVGADEGTAKQVFTRGFTTKSHGHGFGLHNARLIAKAMGGLVEFQSDGAGRGACVSVRMPAPMTAAA